MKKIFLICLASLLFSCNNNPDVFTGVIVKKEYKRGDTYFYPIIHRIGDMTYVQPIPSDTPDSWYVKVARNDTVYEYKVDFQFYIDHDIGDTVTMYK